MIPNSKIYICMNVLLRSDQAHTIYFANEAAQHNYFVARASDTGGRIFTDYTLTRDNVCYVDASIVDAEWWNYCMIEDQANSQDLMRKYYFIESVEYVDENVTALHLKLDVMQTFQHQPNGGYVANLPTCWVEREHSVYDGSRAFNGTSYNTVDEGLETGDFVVRSSRNLFTSTYSIIVASTVELQGFTASSTTVTKCYGQLVNGIWTGLGYYAAPTSRSQAVIDIINHLSDLGFIDAIQDIYLFPSALFDKKSGDTSTDSAPFVRIDLSQALDLPTYWLPIPASVGSYTPKNKKCLQYPYCFAYVTNNAGLSATYKFERYEPESNHPGFFRMHILGNPTSDASAFFYPNGTYDGLSDNKEVGIALTNFPHIPWTADTFKLWLAQTANSRQFNVVQAEVAKVYGTSDLEFKKLDIYASQAGAAIGAVGGALTGNWSAVGSSAVSGLHGIVSQYQNELDRMKVDTTYQLALKGMESEIKDRYITPPQSRGSASGTMAWYSGSLIPQLQLKTIDDMHIRLIDDFFTHYGYRTNAFKTPNISSRPAWNFVKTNGFDVKLQIPNNHKIMISTIFDNGVTFWKDPTKIGNYSQNNAANS